MTKTEYLMFHDLLEEWDRIAAYNSEQSQKIETVWKFGMDANDGGLHESKRLEGKAAGYASARMALENLLRTLSITEQ